MCKQKSRDSTTSFPTMRKPSSACCCIRRDAQVSFRSLVCSTTVETNLYSRSVLRGAPYTCKRGKQQFRSLTEMNDPRGEICRSCSTGASAPSSRTGASQEAPQFVPCGHVYLPRAGSFYKIGMSRDFESRFDQIRLQLPFPVKEVHRIKTDDPEGIERYWHQRFSKKRKMANGSNSQTKTSESFICRDRM